MRYINTYLYLHIFIYIYVFFGNFGFFVKKCFFYYYIFIYYFLCNLLIFNITRIQTLTPPSLNPHHVQRFL